MRQHDREHQPERESGNGGESPGADPDQEDNTKTSGNGDTGRREDGQ